MSEVVVSNAREAVTELLKGMVVVFKGSYSGIPYVLLWNGTARRLYEFYAGDQKLSPTSLVALECRALKFGILGTNFSNLPVKLATMVAEFLGSCTDRFDDEACANFVIAHELLDS